MFLLVYYIYGYNIERLQTTHHMIYVLIISLVQYFYRNQLRRIQSFVKMDISRGYTDSSGRHRREPWPSC